MNVCGVNRMLECYSYLLSNRHPIRNRASAWYQVICKVPVCRVNSSCSISLSEEESYIFTAMIRKVWSVQTGYQSQIIRRLMKELIEKLEEIGYQQTNGWMTTWQLKKSEKDDEVAKDLSAETQNWSFFLTDVKSWDEPLCKALTGFIQDCWCCI